MTDQTPPPEPPRTASPNDVRIVGGCFVIGGLVLIFVIRRNMAIGGILPVWWFGIFVLALGAAMLLFPSTRLFRDRVNRFNEIGEQFSRKRDE